MKLEELADPPSWAGPRTHHLLASSSTLAGQRRLRAAVWAMVVASFVGFLVEGANSPANPHLSDQYLPGTGPPAPPSRGPSGSGSTGLSHP